MPETALGLVEGARGAREGKVSFVSLRTTEATRGGGATAAASPPRAISVGNAPNIDIRASRELREITQSFGSSKLQLIHLGRAHR